MRTTITMRFGVCSLYLTQEHEGFCTSKRASPIFRGSAVYGIWLTGVLGLGLAGLVALWREDARSGGEVAGVLTRPDRHRAGLTAYAAPATSCRCMCRPWPSSPSWCAGQNHPTGVRF